MDSLAVAGLLAELEEALARLYTAYAWRSADYRTLWNDLRLDKLEHADRFRALERSENDGPLRMNRSRDDAMPVSGNGPDPAAVAEALADVRDELARVADGPVAETDALAAALAFEKSILACGFTGCFAEDAPAGRTLRDLRSSTVGHLERVRAAYESAARVAS